jgi:copper chaperone NosL
MIRLLAPLLVITAIVAGCGPKTAAPTPPPFPLTAQAVGHYCGMNLLEHKGPKGQIILASQTEPIWFSSARDAFSFTMLQDEPKDILAVYVSDMGKAPSWDNPGATNWLEARKAFFVIDSTKHGGMGAPETVPFSERAAAAAFAAANGGKAVTFAEVPRDYVLSSDPGFNTKDSGTSGSR